MALGEGEQARELGWGRPLSFVKDRVIRTR